MDKLKIIKTIVFVLTFLMVFLLCLVLTKIMVKSGQKRMFYTISLDVSQSEGDYRFLSDGSRLYVSAGRKIHIISLADKVYEGIVILGNGGEEDGKKEEK